MQDGLRERNVLRPNLLPEPSRAIHRISMLNSLCVRTAVGKYLPGTSAVRRVLDVEHNAACL